MTPAAQLQQVFGTTFSQQPDIPTLRQFHANNAYCTDKEGNLTGICFCENEREEVALPASWAHLQYLNLSDNKKLRQLTFEAALPRLWHLDISDSAVEVLKLPAGFEQLKWLDGSRNQLKKLVLEGDLPQLVYFDVSGNKIEELEVPDCAELQHLYANNNALTHFDISPNARKLEVLHLKGNKLERLPTSIIQLSSLDALYVYDNPLSSIPQESIASGEGESSLENIRNYLRSLAQDETKVNDEIKLVLLGNSTAGKSSLMYLLTEAKYGEGLTSTHGIQNKLWLREDGAFKVNIWDFGGQEFYHATHRLFLSNNAVTVLLFEEKTNFQNEMPTRIRLYEEGEVVEKVLPLQHFPYSYWLDSLNYFCQQQKGDATLLVQNKMDEEDAKLVPVSDQERKQYQLAEENIHRISVKGAFEKVRKYIRRYEDFEDSLDNILQKVKASYQISTRWLEIKEALRELGKEQVMLPYPDYKALCERIRPGISDIHENDKTSMLKTLTDYLHGISVILYYPTIEALKDIVFISPQWVTDIIYRILDYSVIREEGKFDRAHVERVIEQDEKAQMLGSEQLLALMKEFELIFQVKNSTDDFIAPQYLPKENPEKNNKAYKKLRKLCDQHAFTIRYPQFMPRSVITRLICRYGDLADDIFWYNGIVFEKDECNIHLSGDENREITVLMERLEGPVAAELFKNIQQINDRRPDIQVSVNGEDFVTVSALFNHPADNPKIETINGKWIDYERFGVILEGRGLTKTDSPKTEKADTFAHIRQFIHVGKIEAALDILSANAPAAHANNITLFQSQLNILNTNNQRGTLTMEAYNAQLNGIAARILDFIGAVEKGKSAEMPVTQINKPTSPFMLKNNPPKVFISYARKVDTRYFKLLVEGINAHSDWQLFDDRDIRAGEDWKDRLQKEVQECDFAIFLLSPYFFKSEYIKKYEFDEFVKRQSQNGFPFFSILLTDCDFREWEGIADRQIFVAEGQDYDLSKSHRDLQISFDLLARFDRDGELIPNPYLNTFYKNFVQKVNTALGR